MSKLLILGCGKQECPDYYPPGEIVTVDVNENVGADVIHNLDVYPWPFKDNEFDVIHMDNVLEHLDDIVGAMEEIHRVSKDGAIVTIIVPYFRSKWACEDPTHRHFFTSDTLGYFTEGHSYYERYAYSPGTKFKCESRKFNERIDQTWFQRLLIAFAEKHTMYYERKISPLFPLETLTFHLRTSK
jgi:SAM-dependent methyltransferase